MRRVLIAAIVLLGLTGCGAKTSALLLERNARGPLDDARTVGQPVIWTLNPVVQTKTQQGVEMTVNYASPDYLNNFFANTKLFGSFAGKNPYYWEQLVFYVNVANHSNSKIRIDPAEFRLLDDRGNQLATVGVDYVTALAESRQPAVSTATRSVLEEARPGYFGISLPVGKMMTKRPQWRFALLKQSSLQAGDLFPGVVHDGLVAFWNPSLYAKKLSFVLAAVKTDFDAKDEPRMSLDFVFDFDASHP